MAELLTLMDEGRFVELGTKLLARQQQAAAARGVTLEGALTMRYR